MRTSGKTTRKDPEQEVPGQAVESSSSESIVPVVDEYGKPILKGKSGIVINNADRVAMLPKQLDYDNLDYMFSP